VGETQAARMLMSAIEGVTADRTLHTGDLGGTATTRQVTAAVIARIQANPVARAAA
jgi:tartrate dehydrogenase/decarboxylase/D-malate dehydrogenase